MINVFCREVRPDSAKSLKHRNQSNECQAKDLMRIACLWTSMEVL